MPDLKEKRTEVLAPYELEAHHLTDHLFPNDQATNDKSDFLEGKLNVPDDRNSSEDIHIGPGCDGMCSPECDLPDDGADHKCKECGRMGKANTFFLVCTPNGKRAVMCKPGEGLDVAPTYGECIDGSWLLLFAKYRGMFKNGED